MALADVSAFPSPGVTVAGSAAAPAPPQRLASLDAFRGFTMFWIVGGKAVFLALGLISANAVTAAIRYELTHSTWEGLRYYDLIWPSFMLMVGVSIPFSFAKRSLTQTHAQLRRSAFLRAVVLFLLGSFRTSLSNNVPTWVELSSALQPIGLAYLVASLLAEYRPRVQATVGALILVGYGLLLAFVPGPNVPAGSYAKDANLVAYVDRAVLGAPRGSTQIHVVEEGWGTVLSAIPAISTTILGMLLGELLRSPRTPPRKAAVIAGVGLACLALGFGLSPFVPIIMKLWTVTYGLASAGWACLLFLVFYWIIDVQGWKRWSFPLAVVGANALAIYLGASLFPFSRSVGVFTKPILPELGAWGPLFSASAIFLAEWLVLYWMYRRKIFLRA